MEIKPQFMRFTDCWIIYFLLTNEERKKEEKKMLRERKQNVNEEWKDVGRGKCGLM